MHRNTEPWVLVLAAGSGTRLSELTRADDGTVVPKQFCSLRGGRSLLLDTIDRALRLAPRERVVVVVAAEHERWWGPQLTCLDADNIVVQPGNRGTTAGLLLPLARILERDPGAVIAVLPSDHHVDEPAVLTQAMQRALVAVRQDPQHLVLLGIAPDAPDTGYGWIVPGSCTAAGMSSVSAFVEKPPLARANALLQAGALWNSFLFAASGATLWRLCARFARPTATAIGAASLRPAGEREIALDAVYRGLPTIDFSRTVLGACASLLRVLMVPECGWTDLGTPSRAAHCIARIEERCPQLPARAAWFDTVDLATALAGREQRERTGVAVAPGRATAGTLSSAVAGRRELVGRSA
ncbi:MAG TPA: sugar phosphate nucleotidyltransferase [Planctomycetota bacterium]|nr:sugar phosphate nucleotidyltransferase [Planctomycetota bacterium]